MTRSISTDAVLARTRRIELEVPAGAVSVALRLAATHAARQALAVLSDDELDRAEWIYRHGPEAALQFPNRRTYTPEDEVRWNEARVLYEAWGTATEAALCVLFPETGAVPAPWDDKSFRLRCVADTVTATPGEAFDGYFAAVLGGLCGNPNLCEASTEPGALVALARDIVSEALAQRAEAFAGCQNLLAVAWPTLQEFEE